MPRRMSHALAGAVAAAAAEGMEDEDDGYEGPSRRPHSDKEEFFDVTIVRDMVRACTPPPIRPARPDAAPLRSQPPRLA